jgi:hypothetical protein
MVREERQVPIAPLPSPAWQRAVGLCSMDRQQLWTESIGLTWLCGWAELGDHGVEAHDAAVQDSGFSQERRGEQCPTLDVSGVNQRSTQWPVAQILSNRPKVDGGAKGGWVLRLIPLRSSVESLTPEKSPQSSVLRRRTSSYSFLFQPSLAPGKYAQICPRSRCPPTPHRGGLRDLKPRASVPLPPGVPASSRRARIDKYSDLRGPPTQRTVKGWSRSLGENLTESLEPYP